MFLYEVLSSKFWPLGVLVLCVAGVGIPNQLYRCGGGRSTLILSQKVCAGRIRTNVPTPGYNIQPLFRTLPQHTVGLRCAKTLELPQNGFLRGNQRWTRWSFQEDVYLFQDFAYNLSCGVAPETGVPRPPVQALYLVGQYHSRNCAGGGKRDFKGVPPDPGRDGAEERQAGLLVVGLWTQDQGRAVAGLFMASLRRKAQPHDVPPCGDILAVYHSSRPWAGPVSCSG